MAARSVSRSSGTSELIIAGTYRIVKKIGSADSLDIHLGVNIRSGEVCFLYNYVIINVVYWQCDLQF